MSRRSFGGGDGGLCAAGVDSANFHGHIMTSAGHQERTRMGLTTWRACLLKSRGCPTNWRGRLGTATVDLLGFRADLTPVDGHLSSVDAGLTAAGVDLTNVEAG
jgi:hypothetical protein